MGPQFQSVAALARKLQSEIILPAARTIYLGIACVSLVAAIGGILVALFFEMQTWGGPKQVPVPDASAVSPPSIDVGTVAAHLAPPRNVRLIVAPGLLSNPLTGSEVLGYFNADTSNGLPDYPNDFSIIGGKDSALFERTGTYIAGSGARAALTPSTALVNQINGDPANFQAQHAHTFQLRILARDARGNSTPASVTFTFYTGPASTLNIGPALSQSAPPPPVEETTALQQLASQIAAQTDPSHTATFFDTYKRAQRVPQDCGANTDDQMFVGEYRKAFEGTRKQLTASNLEAFFAGMCDAWRQAAARQATEQAQNELARGEAISRNTEAAMQSEIKKAGAKVARNVVASFVVAAFGAFITICLFLAFLAMENHTKAVREAIEFLARAQGSSDRAKRSAD